MAITVSGNNKFAIYGSVLMLPIIFMVVDKTTEKLLKKKFYSMVSIIIEETIKDKMGQIKYEVKGDYE